MAVILVSDFLVKNVQIVTSISKHDLVVPSIC